MGDASGDGVVLWLTAYLGAGVFAAFVRAVVNPRRGTLMSLGFPSLGDLWLLLVWPAVFVIDVVDAAQERRPPRTGAPGPDAPDPKGGVRPMPRGREVGPTADPREGPGGT